ncbi:MAG: hypothetical protein GXO63_03460 [Candidatus Micrarchaeota archaeon]|nr:hypothetical protein [Candidatus Micrarchaeota archaeon]
MKGISLPMNALVILGICLIVLIGIIILFMGVMGPSTKDITMQNFLRNCCTKVMDCSQISNVKCIVPKELESEFGTGEVPITQVAKKIGTDAETYCGCK